MIRDGAPERVSPGKELQGEVSALAGRDDAEARDMPGAHTLEPQIVRILAEVRKLEGGRARFHLHARKGERVLLRDDLNAGRGRTAERKRAGNRCGEKRFHFTSFGRLNFAAPGMMRAASNPSHCSSKDLSLIHI